MAARLGANVGVDEFVRFIVGDWLVGEAPATLRRLDVGVTSLLSRLERGAHHFVYNFDRFAKTVCLETNTLIRVEQSFERWMLIKIWALDRDGLIWDGF